MIKEDKMKIDRKKAKEEKEIKEIKVSKKEEKEQVENSPRDSPRERESKERKLVVPGQIVVKGLDFLPGDGTIREGDNIVAIKFGLLDTVGRLVKVIPLTGAYYPKKEDIVIGKIIDITPVGWVVNFNGPSTGFITLAEGTREYVEKNADLTKYYDFGDLVAARVIAVKARTVDLSMKGPGLRKLDGGLIVKVNTHKVPRVIGRQGSMVNLIKEETNCNIAVGQNGIIWIKGRTIEAELVARNAIKQVEEFSHTNDLTEKIKELLTKSRIKEIKE
ncbi:MAG: exosome complex protein Rrp4 [Nanoarchaeota archaeon]|nr:exosome complex protein Rrp4 [Nanoarchaeota archaeon]